MSPGLEIVGYTTCHQLGSKLSLTRQRSYHDSFLRGRIPGHWMLSLVFMTWPGIAPNEPTGVRKRVLTCDRQG